MFDSIAKLTYADITEYEDLTYYHGDLREVKKATLNNITISDISKLNMVQEVVIGDDVTHIDFDALANCIDLANIYVSNSNKVYGSYDGSVFERQGNILRFIGNSQIEEVHFVPDFIQEVNAVLNIDSRIELVVLGSNVKKVNYLPNVKQYRVHSDNKHLQLIGQSLYSADGKILYKYFDDTNIIDVDLPHDVEVIAKGAFGTDVNIKGTLKLPNTVKQIQQRAFLDCSIETLFLPASISHMDRTALACRECNAILCGFGEYDNKQIRDVIMTQCVLTKAKVIFNTNK